MAANALNLVPWYFNRRAGTELIKGLVRDCEKLFRFLVFTLMPLEAGIVRIKPGILSTRPARGLVGAVRLPAFATPRTICRYCQSEKKLFES
jgi:hypothetical protein